MQPRRREGSILRWLSRLIYLDFVLAVCLADFEFLGLFCGVKKMAILYKNRSHGETNEKVLI